MKTTRRLALAVVLLAATLGLCVVEDATHRQRAAAPTAEEVATDYESAVGQQTLLTGVVESVGEDSVTLRIESRGPSITLTATGADPAVDPGGVLQVFGTLEPEQTIAAERTVVVSQSGSDETYKWAVSAVGVALFLGLFFRQWTVDYRALRVEVREGG